MLGRFFGGVVFVLGDGCNESCICPTCRLGVCVELRWPISAKI